MNRSIQTKTYESPMEDNLHWEDWEIEKQKKPRDREEEERRFFSVVRGGWMGKAQEGKEPLFLDGFVACCFSLLWLWVPVNLIINRFVWECDAYLVEITQMPPALLPYQTTCQKCPDAFFHTGLWHVPSHCKQSLASLQISFSRGRYRLAEISG